LPRPDSEYAFQLDSQEAQEAAQVDESRMTGATWTWARLSNEERQIVRDVTDKICGRGEGEELAYDLEIRIAPNQQKTAEKGHFADKLIERMKSISVEEFEQLREERERRRDAVLGRRSPAGSDDPN
jgi:hypothetical protein